MILSNESAQFLESKMWGKLAKLREEIAQTLGKAVKQLHRFDEDRAKGAVKDQRLAGVRHVERLVVTYDYTAWSNLVIRDQALAVAGIPADYHVHVATIDDFERLLGHCWQGCLFDVLVEKRTNSDWDVMDIGDWIATHLETAQTRNPYLDDTYQTIVAGWALPGDELDEWGESFGLEGAQRLRERSLEVELLCGSDR
jgi:hypothetical protein